MSARFLLWVRNSRSCRFCGRLLIRVRPRFCPPISTPAKKSHPKAALPCIKSASPYAAADTPLLLERLNAANPSPPKPASADVTTVPPHI